MLETKVLILLASLIYINITSENGAQATYERNLNFVEIEYLRDLICSNNVYPPIYSVSQIHCGAICVSTSNKKNCTRFLFNKDTKQCYIKINDTEGCNFISYQSFRFYLLESLVNSEVSQHMGAVTTDPIESTSITNENTHDVSTIAGHSTSTSFTSVLSTNVGHSTSSSVTSILSTNVGQWTSSPASSVLSTNVGHSTSSSVTSVLSTNVVHSTSSSVTNVLSTINSNLCDGRAHGENIPHLSDCTKYYTCNFGTPIERNCGPATHFSATLQLCDHPSNADCQK